MSAMVKIIVIIMLFVQILWVATPARVNLVTKGQVSNAVTLMSVPRVAITATRMLRVEIRTVPSNVNVAKAIRDPASPVTMWTNVLKIHTAVSSTPIVIIQLEVMNVLVTAVTHQRMVAVLM
jgi:hypothetical protein